MTDPADHPERSRFELPVAGGGAAFASYELSPGTMTLTHVIVPAHAEGQGVGSKLTAYALEQARARGLKVIPACPFVAAYIDRHPEHADLLA